MWRVQRFALTAERLYRKAAGEVPSSSSRRRIEQSMDPGRIIFPSEQTYYPTMKKQADPPVARRGEGGTKKGEGRRFFKIHLMKQHSGAVRSNQRRLGGDG